eukprot:scaffold806_cov229-Pinguiococcus_pyrenoidosus.AAC.4
MDRQDRTRCGAKRLERLNLGQCRGATYAITASELRCSTASEQSTPYLRVRGGNGGEKRLQAPALPLCSIIGRRPSVISPFLLASVASRCCGSRPEAENSWLPPPLDTVGSPGSRFVEARAPCVRLAPFEFQFGQKAGARDAHWWRGTTSWEMSVSEPASGVLAEL